MFWSSKLFSSNFDQHDCSRSRLSIVNGLWSKCPSMEYRKGSLYLACAHFPTSLSLNLGHIQDPCSPPSRLDTSLPTAVCLYGSVQPVRPHFHYLLQQSYNFLKGQIRWHILYDIVPIFLKGKLISPSTGKYFLYSLSPTAWERLVDASAQPDYKFFRSRDVTSETPVPLSM